MVGQSWQLSTALWRQIGEKKKYRSKKLSRWWGVEVDAAEWGRRRIRERADWVANALEYEGRVPGTFFQAMEVALKLHKSQPSGLILLAEQSRICWLERNKFVFENVRVLTPDRVILGVVEENTKAAWRKMKGEKAADIRRIDEVFLERTKALVGSQRTRRRMMEEVI
ncbi:hypothetical protein R1sor_010083 [Riccia sorocarpa]|uniref:Uncharacterized protein n=1 Tax=Riccia sorocarpa TaxID=122646 RepID=A0ABD3HZP6_9MARC